MGNALVKNNNVAHTNFTMRPIEQIAKDGINPPIFNIEYDGLKLRFKEPYQLLITLDIADGDVYFVHRNAKLDMSIHGRNLDELAEEFFSEIVFLWRTYALNDDSKLTPDAACLKKHLLSMLVEV